MRPIPLSGNPTNSLAKRAKTSQAPRNRLPEAVVLEHEPVLVDRQLGLIALGVAVAIRRESA